MVTLTWHACKYKVHKLHQIYNNNNINNNKKFVLTIGTHHN